MAGATWPRVFRLVADPTGPDDDTLPLSVPSGLKPPSGQPESGPYPAYRVAGPFQPPGADLQGKPRSDGAAAAFSTLAC